MGYKYLYTSWREGHKIILQSFVMHLQIYSYGCGTVIKFSLQIQILEKERVIGHFFLGAGNVIIAGHLTLSNPCVSSYGYLAVIKIGQQLHQLERSTYGSLPQLLLTSVLCGPVTLTILDITNVIHTQLLKIYYLWLFMHLLGKQVHLFSDCSSHLGDTFIHIFNICIFKQISKS